VLFELSELLFELLMEPMFLASDILPQSHQLHPQPYIF
jgi:hypothetical protein